MAKARMAPPIKTPNRPTAAEHIPRRVMNPTINDHLEIMTRAIFQAGLSWAMIASRWHAFRTAFEDFDISRVAEYGEFDIERLMHTDGIVHSAKKFAGTIDNARALRAIDRQFGAVSAYVGGFATYADLLTDARRRFAFLGDLSCYYWLFRCGAPVPLFETWISTQPKDHPRMREMVLAGRTAGNSTEREAF